MSHGVLAGPILGAPQEDARSAMELPDPLTLPSPSAWAWFPASS